MNESYDVAWHGGSWRDRPVVLPPPPLTAKPRKRPQTPVSEARWRVSLALQSGPHTARELQAMTGLSPSAITIALKHLRQDRQVTGSPEPPAFGRPRVRYTWKQQ